MHISCLRNVLFPSIKITSFVKSKKCTNINVKLLTDFLKSSILLKEAPSKHHEEVSIDSPLLSF